MPNHLPLNIGTLAAIIAEVADKQGMTRERLIDALLVWRRRAQAVV